MPRSKRALKSVTLSESLLEVLDRFFVDTLALLMREYPGTHMQEDILHMKKDCSYKAGKPFAKVREKDIYFCAICTKKNVAAQVDGYARSYPFFYAEATKLFHNFTPLRLDTYQVLTFLWLIESQLGSLAHFVKDLAYPFMESLEEYYKEITNLFPAYMEPQDEKMGLMHYRQVSRASLPPRLQGVGDAAGRRVGVIRMGSGSDFQVLLRFSASRAENALKETPLKPTFLETGVVSDEVFYATSVFLEDGMPLEEAYLTAVSLEN